MVSSNYSEKELKEMAKQQSIAIRKRRKFWNASFNDMSGGICNDCLVKQINQEKNVKKRVFNNENLFLFFSIFISIVLAIWLSFSKYADNKNNIIIFIGLLIIHELIHWSNITKPAYESCSTKINATIISKLLSATYAIILLFVTGVIVKLSKKLITYLIHNYMKILTGIGFFVLIVLGACVYFWLNSFRINKKDLKTKSKEENIFKKLHTWFFEVTCDHCGEILTKKEIRTNAVKFRTNEYDCEAYICNKCRKKLDKCSKKERDKIYNNIIERDNMEPENSNWVRIWALIVLFAIIFIIMWAFARFFGVF